MESVAVTSMLENLRDDSIKPGVHIQDGDASAKKSVLVRLNYEKLPNFIPLLYNEEGLGAVKITKISPTVKFLIMTNTTSFIGPHEMYHSFLGSGPDRELCPVEHRGKIPSVGTCVRTSLCMSPMAGSGYLEAGSSYL